MTEHFQNYIYIYISFLLVTSLLSHDLASWSEGQSREAVLQHGDLLSNYFIGMQKMTSKFRSMYKNLHLLTKRLGSSFVTAWSDSLMQGMQGYSDSWLHSHISKFVIKKFNQLEDLPKMLTAQGAHNIDDVLLTIKTESKVSSKVAEKLFGVLESTYKGLGYIIDRAKSLLSDCKFVLLSRYFIRGAELMLPLKTCIRAAVSLKNELPCLYSKVNEILAFYKSIQSRPVSNYYTDFIKFCDLSHVKSML